MDKSLESFLEEENLSLCQSLGRGRSSHIFLVKNLSGKRFVAKVERPDSTRFKMAEREAENLGKANSRGVGPRLEGFDLGKKIILMEFVEGQTFSTWLFSNPERKALKFFTKALLGQAKALDSIGLDHGQLAGRGKNILVRKNKPVIIDFEKASCQRKCHNLSVLQGFLFRNPRGAIAEKVRKIMGKKEIEKFIS